MPSDLAAPQLPAAPPMLELDDGLFLRHLTLGDAPLVYATIDAHRAFLRRWLPWVDPTRSVADTIHFIEESAGRRAAGVALVYGIWHDLEFCGVVDLHAIDPANGSAQIGYWLKEDAQGRGLITYSCAALLGVAFEILGLERVEIRCGTENHRSASVPKRLAFTEEGVLRHAQRLGEGFVDLRLFSLLAEEYRAALAVERE
jgi:ribosomal-protein-serine acetyltransferase